MSVIARFKTGETLYCARIFERGSRKGICSVCGELAFGILVRFLDPFKRDAVICDRCVLGLAEKEFVKLKIKPEKPKPSRPRRVLGRPKKRGRKKGWRKRTHPKIEKLIAEKISAIEVVPQTEEVEADVQT